MEKVLQPFQVKLLGMVFSKRLKLKNLLEIEKIIIEGGGFFNTLVEEKPLLVKEGYNAIKALYPEEINSLKRAVSTVLEGDQAAEVLLELKKELKNGESKYDSLVRIGNKTEILKNSVLSSANADDKTEYRINKEAATLVAAKRRQLLKELEEEKTIIKALAVKKLQELGLR